MFQNIPVWLILTIGFSAQMFFGLRTMLQWLKSEAAHKSVSPVSYWIFSVIGACLMFIYGVIRNDFPIIGTVRKCCAFPNELIANVLEIMYL